MGKRNHEWPDATAWDGYTTQDKAEGVTERVPPSLVMERLEGEGFLKADQTGAVEGDLLVRGATTGQWTPAHVTVSESAPTGAPAEGDLFWFVVEPL
jgi:hypothetical protein